MSKIDLTGQRFGLLTVISETTLRKNRSVVWKCLCDCGKIAEVSSRHLIPKTTQSCGCLRKKPESNLGKKKCNHCKEKLNIENCKILESSPEKLKWALCDSCRKEYYQKVRSGEDYGIYKNIFRKYGITIPEYLEIFEQQDGKCKICGKPSGRESGNSPSDRRLCIDHDHKTGRVRGLLCRTCNSGLGMFMDDPKIIKSAAKYLENGE